MSIINKLFINKTDSTLIQLLRYTFVGGGAFVVDFSLLWFLTSCLDINYLFSSVISFLTGLVLNYLISIHWVFAKNTAVLQNKAIEFFIFLIIGVIGLLLNSIIIWFVTEKLNLYYLLSKLISAAIVYQWNFFARKYALFSHKKLSDND